MLVATSELAAWTLASDGVTTCGVIEYHDGALVGIDRLNGVSFDVTRDGQIVCKLNLRTLATRVVEALGGRIDYSSQSLDAKVHRLGRLPPNLGSAPLHFCVRCDDDSLLAVTAALACSVHMVVLVPTLCQSNIDVDSLAKQFKTFIVALDELIIETNGQWNCQTRMLDELRNQLGIGDTAVVNAFRLDGENYQICFNGKRFSLSNSVGLWYVREFLTHPSAMFDPVELESARTGVNARSSNSSTGESFDPEARRQYARQLAEIDEEIAEATSFNDIGRLEKLQNDRQGILDYVAKATRKGGKARVATDASKARKNIRQQVNRDLDRIRTFCPELAEHLRVAFLSDAMCYQPDHDPRWQF